MRKQILLLPMLGAITLILFSCQKEALKNENTDQLVSKVNNWLDGRKPVGKPTQAENVDLLKNNLEYSRLRIEQSSGDEKIIIIPVKENFKTIKNIDKSSIPNLVLILDKMGNVRIGNIVLFYPKNEQAYSKVPDNTFYNILNTAQPECDGKFRYLSVTGKRLHELEYENGQMKSFGYLQDSIATGNRTNTFCVHWFWVYTWYDQWGNIWSQEREYYGSTCQGEDCEDPYNAMLCPIENMSGGATGPEGEWEHAVRRTVIWAVKSGGVGGAYVSSDETVIGKRSSSWPGGGYFTGINHHASICSCPTNGVWFEDLTNSKFEVIMNGLKARSYVIGAVSYQGFNYQYSNTGQWNFDEVF